MNAPSTAEWSARFKALEQRIGASAAPDEPPPLEVPQALTCEWINRYGVWTPYRTSTNWEMVIAEAARWGQRQGWNARGCAMRLKQEAGRG